MNIAQVTAIPLAIPPKDGTIPWIWETFNQVMVEVKTDDGLVGWGEAYGYGQAASVTAMVNHTLRPLLVGRDASDIRGILDSLFRKTHLFGRYGVTTFAISGVEVALWDLAGKRAGKPLYELLGGAAEREIKAYASLVRYADRDRMAEHAAQAVREGYEMVKLHQIDVDSVRAARVAIGDGTPLAVDINCEWSPLEAAHMAVAMDEYDLYWLEEPVWPPEDYAGLAAVMESTGVALASGENACTAHQFKLMMEQGAVAYPQPSVIKVGGIAEFLKVATLAETHNLSLGANAAWATSRPSPRRCASSWNGSTTQRWSSCARHANNSSASSSPAAPRYRVAAGAGRRRAAHRRALRSARPTAEHRHHRPGRYHRRIA